MTTDRLLLACLAAILALNSMLSQPEQILVQASSSSIPANNSTIKPYWQRPGCYQVGHTRTISIPGCVKFNLSTNACRGYCMSFSIPNPEDIGPGSGPLVEELADGGPNRLAGGQSISNMDNQQLLMLLTKGNSNNNNNNQDYPELEQQQLTDMIVASKKKKKSSLVADLSILPLLSQMSQQSETTANSNSNNNNNNNNKELDKLNTFLHLSGQTRSPLAGTVGNTNDKRDVISVGQCCQMIETEDVTVNLRCGHNETRRLVFKSAKTCECFFCKHV